MPYLITKRQHSSCVWPVCRWSLRTSWASLFPESTLACSAKAIASDPHLGANPSSGRAVAICTSSKGERAKGGKSPIHIKVVENAKNGRGSGNLRRNVEIGAVFG